MENGGNMDKVCFEQITAYLEKQILDAQAMQAYLKHRQVCESWDEGFIAEYWQEDGCLCVRYESGKWWHYKDIDSSEFTYW